MKILLVNASPKRKKTASAYFLHLLKLMLNKKTKTVLLRNKNDFNNVIDNMKDSLIVIFSFPLYVDSLPSHLLAFLKLYDKISSINSYGGASHGLQDYFCLRQLRRLLRCLPRRCHQSGR